MSETRSKSIVALGGELPVVPCPHCWDSAGGRIFQDARGGYECTCCDGRFLIQRDVPHGYGGPGGPLSWRERHSFELDRWGHAAGGATGAALAMAHWGTALVLGVLSFVLIAAGANWKFHWRVP